LRLVLYTGKGGVGKTTTAAATAAHAAQRGVATLVLSADPAHSLGDVLGRPVGREPTDIAPNLAAVEIDARRELARHWGRIHDYLVSLFRHQGIEEVVAEELALLPGADELTTLMAVDEYARSGAFDFIVIDCAPTAATLRLVTLPDVAHGALRILLKLQRAIASIVTPLAASLVPVPLPDSRVFKDVERLLYDTLRRLRGQLEAAETSVRIVVTPERMVIDEARRAYTDLSLFDLACDAVVMNRLLPEAAASEPFFRDWARLGRERLVEVEEAFAPRPVLVAPLQRDEVIGVEALRALGRELFGERAPEAMLSDAPRTRFVRAGDGYCVHIPLPGASAADLEVVVVEGDLLVSAGAHRRSLRLPERVAACSLTSARLAGGELVVGFEGDPPRGQAAAGDGPI
jgi:arsenite-transporting ATPase